MFQLFIRYLSIGAINTIIHWCVFYLLHYIVGVNQAFSNLGAFCVAITFSFFANAQYTFRAETTTTRYLLYVIFMGTLSAAVGAIADNLRLTPIVTLIVFSAISLLCGFFYSKFIVFRSRNK
ncbi:GtrA family protein [Collimonas sp. NPDC087041]|uniref:GtrA family protein n=1 Tax=Collimonas sp. NPDC087041 TaxID=3363960 RepID=UPI00382AF69F